MPQEKFTGDQKNSNYFLFSFEKKIIPSLLRLVPSGLGTVQLTLMTLVWSVLIVLCGYWSSLDIRWLWLFNVLVFFQHITDMLDGAIGRMRKEGLIRWGFYMDHFLDYVFLCAVVIGYSFLLPDSFLVWVLLCLGVCGGIMVHFFLDFAVTKEFKISFNQFGSSEIRYVLIAFNTILIFSGKHILVYTFPFVTLILSTVLFTIIYKSQKVFWSMDRKELKEE